MVRTCEHACGGADHSTHTHAKHVVRFTQAVQLYRGSTVGLALTDALDELVRPLRLCGLAFAHAASLHD